MTNNNDNFKWYILTLVMSMLFDWPTPQQEEVKTTDKQDFCLLDFMGLISLLTLFYYPTCSFEKKEVSNDK